MKRSKENSIYWHSRMDKLFELEPSLKDIENRYKALEILLQKDYQPIVKSVSVDSFRQFLRDVIYLDRELRRETEGEQEDLKEILSQEKQIELGYEPGYNQKLKI